MSVLGIQLYDSERRNLDWLGKLYVAAIHAWLWLLFMPLGAVIAYTKLRGIGDA